MRKPFVAGNWKMNTDSQSSIRLADEIAARTMETAGDKAKIAVIPPFVYLPAVVKALGSSNIAVGAQDVYYEKNGAFTGEISVSMLKDAGCSYVLCGHSERRHIIGETDELINKKVTAAILGGVLPILCVGELFEQRKAGQTAEVVTGQMKKGFSGLSEEKASAVTVAGLTATPEQAQEVHAMIRKLVGQMYNWTLAEQMCIMYGGSAKPDNAAALMAQPDVDGLLVGGASLKAADFVGIIEASTD